MLRAIPSGLQYTIDVSWDMHEPRKRPENCSMKDGWGRPQMTKQLEKPEGHHREVRRWLAEEADWEGCYGQTTGLRDTNDP
jgi:hypothetical protein